MTETKKILNFSLIEKVKGMPNFTLICMYLGSIKALEGVTSLTGEEAKCQNRPFCREMQSQMEEKGLKQLLENDKTIEEDILTFIGFR